MRTNVHQPERVGAPRRRLSLAQEITEGLRERILSGELSPGDRIAEMEIAREFETSQGPVREAFAILRQEGLLISFPRRGTFVSDVSEEEARSAYEIRMLLEPYAMEKAIARIDDEDIGGFATDLERMRAAARAKDHTELVAADMRFHGRFYELSGSALAAAIWSRTEATVRKFIAITDQRLYTDDDELAGVVADHEALLRLVKARDTKGLRRELERQIRTLWARMDAATTASGAKPRADPT